MPRPQLFAIGQLDRVRIDETRVAAVEIELSGEELARAMAGEVPDDPGLAGLDGLQVGGGPGILSPSAAPVWARCSTSAE